MMCNPVLTFIGVCAIAIAASTLFVYVIKFICFLTQLAEDVDKATDELQTVRERLKRLEIETKLDDENFFGTDRGLKAWLPNKPKSRKKRIKK